MFPHSSAFSPASTEIKTEEDEEFQEQVEVKVEPEQENQENINHQTLFQFVKEKQISKQKYQILNEPQEDEWANETDFEPGEMELKFILKEEESLTENEQDSITITNTRGTYTPETSPLTPFQIPGPTQEEMCSFCGKKFPTHRKLLQHTRIHDKKYKCPLCEYATFNVTAWKAHQLSHTGAKPWKCLEPNCKMAFRQKPSLQKHKLNFHSKKHEQKMKKFHCELCTFKTIRQVWLKKHVNVAHPKLKNPVSSESTVQIPDKGPEMTKLTQAKAIRKIISSSSSSDLVVKILNKEPEPKLQPELLIEAAEPHTQNYSHKEQSSKPQVKGFTLCYKCDSCDFYTKQDKQLAIHLYSHNLPRVILKKYKILQSPDDENSSVDLHLQSSIQKEKEVEIPRSHFKCPEPNCTYSNPRKYNVGCHLFTQHGRRRDLKILRCSFCSYETPRPYRMKLHADSVHQRFKKFRCDVKGCFYKTTSRGNLSNHKTQVHNMEKLYKQPLNEK